MLNWPTVLKLQSMRFFVCTKFSAKSQIHTVDSEVAAGRPRALDQGDMNYIYSILEANPGLYLDEIQQRLFQAREVEVSIATICRALQRLAVSNKKVAREALERDEIVRATWLAEYGDIPMESCLWLDESSVDDRTNQRRNGWAPLGRACVRRETFIRGSRFSVLPALSVDGIVALDIFEGSVTKERFIYFLKEQIVRKTTTTIIISNLTADKAPILTPWPVEKLERAQKQCIGRQTRSVQDP